MIAIDASESSAEFLWHGGSFSKSCHYQFCASSACATFSRKKRALILTIGPIRFPVVVRIQSDCEREITDSRHAAKGRVRAGKKIYLLLENDPCVTNEKKKK